MIRTALIALSFALACSSSTLTPRDEIDSSNSETWPAPNITGGTGWADAFAKASSLVANMTLPEKVNLTTGVNGSCVGNLGSIPRLGIPELCLEDGPAGVRPVHGVSQFPAGLTTAATWDRDLMYRRSLHMGKEFYDQGVNIALAPVTGGPLGRSPEGGRNWEGWFADPYATGIASYQSVLGLQKSGIMAVGKHYIGYEQETYRNAYGVAESYSVFPLGVQYPISSNIDDKTTHEVYLWSFAEAVRAGIASFMCSYNRVNQTQACSNAYTLNHLLKTELNFQGSVVSDWGGQHDSVDSALNGMDISMPGDGFGGLLGGFWGSNLTALVENGTIPEQRVDDMVLRLLTPWIHLGQDTTPLPDHVFNAASSFYDAPDVYRDVRQPDTAKLIREIGANGATLLKNTGGLPLKNPQRIVVLGTDAMDNDLGPDGCGGDLNSCPVDNNNGTLSMGGGSGYAIAPYVVTPLDALKQRALQNGSEIRYILKDTDANSTIQTILPTADVAIVFVQDYSTEGRDRADITLDHEGDELIAAAVNSSSNVIVVMHIPGVVDVEKWADNENVTAIVAAWLPGQETGNSIADVLYGDVNPSGKLPFTWAKSLDDYYPDTIVSDPVIDPQANFTEGVFLDYRWFDSKNITPRYEFGYGLSYTTFEYSNIVLDDTSSSDSSSIQTTAEPFAEWDGSNSLYDVLFTVSATILNSGNLTGSEVAQLYVSIPEDDQPPRVLRGFEKVKDLASGESATATFELRRKDLSVWSATNQTWYVPEGEFTIYVGASSRNLPLTTTWSA